MKIKWWLPGLIVLLADRVVKMTLGQTACTLIPGVIALSPARNTGMAFGLLTGNTGVVLLLSAAVIALCIFCLRGVRLRGLAPVAVSMIVGGAIGNMIDRVTLGYVTDMFELLFVHFYVFNLADVCIVAGAVLCGFSLLFRPQDWSREKK